MEPKVTAVIVNWNRKADIIALLDSLLSLAYGNISIVVVDNASTDDSVAAIKAHPLEVTILENPINLGGTGGFNTGLSYALDHYDQKYIWLLDNDAIVTPEALSSLVLCLEHDSSIAIAGSKILNKQDPSFIVETGARIDWRTASVIPVNRNVTNFSDAPALFDVEYVAICSALVRSSAIRQVGIMDERYFLLWDDMDWGVSFCRAGYRIVAVNDSIIYHPPFTEKRSVAVDNYYGIRNPLLTASKQTQGLLRFWALLTLCRRACRTFVLTSLDGQMVARDFCKKALNDFLFNRWGKLVYHFPESRSDDSWVDSEQILSFLRGRVLILNAGSSEEIRKVVNFLKINCMDKVEIDLVVQGDRCDIVDADGINDVIKVDFETKNSLFRNTIVFTRLLCRRYANVINPSIDKTSPFAFISRKTIRIDVYKNIAKVEKRNSLAILPALVVLSEVASLIILPFIYLRSIFYSTEN